MCYDYVVGVNFKISNPMCSVIGAEGWMAQDMMSLKVCFDFDIGRVNFKISNPIYSLVRAKGWMSQDIQLLTVCFDFDVGRVNLKISNPIYSVIRALGWMAQDTRLLTMWFDFDVIGVDFEISKLGFHGTTKWVPFDGTQNSIFWLSFKLNLPKTIFEINVNTLSLY